MQLKEWPLTGGSIIFRLGFVAVFWCLPTLCFAADKCDILRRKLTAESELAKNQVARERAAIADLNDPRLEEMYQKRMAGKLPYEIYEAERNKWDQGLNCINADAELKHYQIDYDEEAKLKAAGCQREPITKWIVDSVKQRAEWKSRDCGKVDLEYLAGMVKRLNEVKAEKAANEEPPVTVVKKADLTARDGDFCRQLRTVSSEAMKAFRGITGEKVSKNFYGQTKISEMVGADTFSTSVTLAPDFLGTTPKCSVVVGNENQPDLALRSALHYECTWDYERTNRRQLEERADRIANMARGCFGKISESAGDSYRHSFEADGRIEVNVSSYYGDKAPSHLSMSLYRHAIDEFAACIAYTTEKKASAKQLCMKRFER